MTNDTVKHKLRVFISSKCGGRYEIARKALEKLLNETGLVECYCFETEPGSSESMPSAYLDQIHTYQLFLLIVDNEDKITDATMSEYKKAKELGLRIVGIFCNETSKKKTEVEEEMIKSGLCKFDTAARFSDIVELSYRTVMQDILNVYTKKPAIPEPITIVENVSNVSINTAIQIEKNILNQFESTKHSILDSFYKVKPKQGTPTEADTLFQKFLQFVLGNGSFDENLFNQITTIVLEKHTSEIREIIQQRLDAIKFYFTGDIDNCVLKLEETIEKIKGLSNIPYWLYNDVAIDLRNMIITQDSMKNIISIHNKGQNILDDSEEYVHFPVLDRIGDNIKKNVIKEYSKINLQSPYSTSIGGLDYLFADVSSYYCVALLYGSITHLRLIRSRMIEILEVLSQEYSNQEFHSELIRFLILEADDKKLKSISRTYNRSYDIISSTEIEKIINSISYLPTEYDKTHSTLLLLKYFGYYLTEAQYSNHLDWFLKYTKKWACDKKRIFNFNDIIKTVYQSCCERIPSKEIAEFMISLFNSNNYILYGIACELMGYVKIKDLSVDMQQRIEKHLLKLINNKKSRENTHQLRNALILFVLNTTIDITTIEKAIKLNMESFYKGEYHLELYDKDKKASLKQIDKYIQSIQARIEAQGKNGCYSGFMGDPFETIGNIITINAIKLNWRELEPIVVATSNFILAPNQSCGEKRQAITLLTTLVLTHPKLKQLSDYISSTIQARDSILKVISLDLFDTTNIQTLSVALDCLGLLIGKISPTDVMSSLSTINTMDDRDIIACMNYLSKSLEKANLKNLPDEITASILQLAISLFSNKERDVRFLGVKCLIELTHSKYQDIALKQLSICMDSGCADIRLAIISRIKKIKDNSSTKQYIIQKAKIDNHYLVREIAKEKETA